MSSQSSVPTAKSASSSSGWKLGITFAAYGLLLLVAALSIPLRIPEVLQIAPIRDFSLPKYLGWIAQAPGSSPLNPLLQVSLLVAGGPSRFAARCLSVVFAVAACYLFLRLVRRIPLERPYWALLIFMLLPAHFELSFLSRPFEQALFLLVLATECFFRMVSRPHVRTALFYAVCLTLCLYTDRYSFLPAIGYLLSLLRFVYRAQERRALWYALAATAVPLLLFLPYAFWARTQVNADWFIGPAASLSGIVYVRALRSLAEERWATYILSVLLTVGIIVGSGTSFRVTGGAITKRIRLFALSGGICSTIVLAISLDISQGEPFTSAQVLWITPALVILICAGLEWLVKVPGLRRVTVVAIGLLVAICAAADAHFLIQGLGSAPREDIQAVAAAVPGQLTGNSCVVFVSEQFSKSLFLLFQPELASRECLDFFHERIVLASHPYVRPDQQQDAESFFHGLDMMETRRLRAGGGQIVVMQQNVVQ